MPLSLTPVELRDLALSVVSYCLRQITETRLPQHLPFREGFLFRGSIHSLALRPTPSLSTLHAADCPTSRKTRYRIAGYALCGCPSITSADELLGARNV